MDVSVVVSTRNRAQRLAALLESLRGQTLSGFEVVVVDDGSTDGTAELLDRERTRPGLELRVLRRERSGGPATGREEGWRAARAPLIAFTDDDVVAAPDWIEQGLRAAAANPGALVQGRTDPNPAEVHLLGPFSRTLEVTSLGPWFQTCNIFFPRELLERLGGFDTSFRNPGGEDTDLAWRALAAGAPAVFAGEARNYHAVARLGPLGKLRVAWRWSYGVQVFAKHPERRRELLEKRLFWKGSHYLLVRALLGLLLPRRLHLIRAWLLWPYFHHLRWRGRTEGGGLLLAPYYALHDVVELVAILRGAVRYRVPVL